MSDEFDDVQDGAAERGVPRMSLGPRRGPVAHIPKLIAAAYSEATGPLRVRLLECLLRPVGVLGLVAIAAGAFGELLRRGSYQRLEVSLDDAARVTADQMLELARYVEQCSPDTFQQVSSMLADTPLGIASVSGSVLLLALRAWHQRRTATGRSAIAAATPHAASAQTITAPDGRSNSADSASPSA
jgi:hypothetical protein